MKSLRVSGAAGVILLITVLFFTAESFAATETNKSFWLLEAPEEWPAQVMPGVIIGSNKPLAYFDNLVPLAGTIKSMLFADVKAVIGPNGSNEQNIGLGARTLLFDEKFLLGGNFFYDTRYTENKVRHDQLAFGLEGLSKWVDARTNFYFPISGKKYLNDQAYYGFRSRSLALVTPYEEPLTGLDYEAGVLIPYLSDYIETRAFMGGYNYFPDEGKGLNGIKGRVEIRPIKAFTINVEVKHDNYVGTEYFVESFISVPLDTMNIFKIRNPLTEFTKYFAYKKGIRPLRERMVDRIVRDINVVLDPKTQTTESTVHDMTYVDNSFLGTSDGSLEHPYTTIANGVTNATGDKWIYVNKGSSDYSENITLTDNVTLWGAGYNGGFTGINAVGNPVIDGGGAVNPGITLANNNTVMGFTVQNGLRGIFGHDVQNTTVDHNTISSASQEGIKLDIDGSTTGTYTISNNTVTGNGGTAQIYAITQGTTTPTFYIDNNTSSSGIGTARGIKTDFKGNSIGNVRMSGNIVQDNPSFGINIYGYDSAIISTCEVKDNTLSGNISTAIAVTSASGSSSFSSVLISGNNIYQNLGHSGIQVLLNDGTTGSMDNVSVANNTLTGNEYGIIFFPSGSGTMTVTAYGNVVSESIFEGIGIYSRGTGAFNGSFYNNTSKNNGTNGLDIGQSGYLNAVTADFGGGSLGSIGHNSIYGNTNFDIGNLSLGPVTAQYNWWGTATPADSQFSESLPLGIIDHANPLSSDPN